jgi:hypothetical protein
MIRLIGRPQDELVRISIDLPLIGSSGQLKMTPPGKKQSAGKQYGNE